MKPPRLLAFVSLLACCAGGVALTLNERAEEQRSRVPNAQVEPLLSEPADVLVALGTTARAREQVTRIALVTPAASNGDLRVSGAVRGEHGELVPEARLRWVDARGAQVETTVERGAYSIGGLRAGHWIVEATGKGWRDERFEVELEARPAIQQRDLQLHATSLHRVLLVDRDGQPLTGFEDDEGALRMSLTVLATRDAPGETLAPANVLRRAISEYGCFRNRWDLERTGPRLRAGCLGVLELAHEAPLYVSLVSGTAVLATQKLDALPDEIVFPIALEAIGWRSAGLQVHLRRPEETPPAHDAVALAPSRPSAPVSVRTDADGRFEPREPVAGLAHLPIAALTVPTLKHTPAPAPSPNTGAGHATPLEPQTLRVRFEFPDGQPRNVQFVLMKEPTGDPFKALKFLDDLGVATGPDGIAELSPPATGKYVLRVLAVGEHMQNERFSLGARPQRIVFGVEPPSEIVVPLVRMTDLELWPAPDASGITRWLISTSNGIASVRVRVAADAPTRIRLAPGAYSIARIQPELHLIEMGWAFMLGETPLAIDLEP